jgi:hypothetical protein
LPLSFEKLRMVSLAEPFFKEGYKGTFVLLEPITEGLRPRGKYEYRING